MLAKALNEQHTHRCTGGPDAASCHRSICLVQQAQGTLSKHSGCGAIPWITISSHDRAQALRLTDKHNFKLPALTLLRGRTFSGFG